MVICISTPSAKSWTSSIFYELYMLHSSLSRKDYTTRFNSALPRYNRGRSAPTGTTLI